MDLDAGHRPVERRRPVVEQADRLSADEDDPVAVMKAFEKEGWMKILFPAWTTAKVDSAGLTALQKTRQQLTDIGVQSDPAAATARFRACSAERRGT